MVCCGNTNAICKKLDSLCKVGFQSANVLVSPIHTQPLPTEDIPRVSSSNSRPRTESGNRDADVNGLDGSNVTDPSRRVHSADHKTRVNNTLESDLLDLVSSNHTPRNAAVIPEKVKKVKQAYGETTSNKGSKKSDAPSKSFGRNSMDAPPSVELMAKFALEKEQLVKAKYKQEIQQQVYQEEIYDQEFYEFDDNNGGNGWSQHPQQNEGMKGKGKKAVGKGGKPTGASKKKSAKKTPSMEENPFMAAPGYGNSYFPMNMPMAMPQGLSSGNSIISASESDFMVRQVQHGDMVSVLGDNDSVLSNGTLQSLGGGSVGSLVNNNNTGNPGVSGRVNEAMRERVAVLEKNITQLTAQIVKKDGEIEKYDQKLRRVTMELDATRKGASKEMQLLIESHEKDIIRLREQHSKEMANMTLGIEDPNDHFPLPKREDKSHDANRHLIQQLEILQAENRKLQEKANEDRRTLIVDSNTKLITQERQYKAEISLLRGQLTTLEDSLLMKEDEVTNNKANVDNMKSIVRQLELEKNELAGERMKLRNELKNMQQSTAASYKLESSQGIGAGVDADTAIRINEATSDAKVRTLTNKVDFLKAQLGAEQSAMEEMREGMETNRRIMEEMKNEFRLQLNEAEQNKRKAVEDAERRVEMVYEERMSELTTLQTRVMMVQGQLNEAFQESTIMKQREENLKQQSAKANAQQAALKSEIDQLRAQVNDLRDEKEQILSKDMNKHSSEAVIRRLDNERQYLKSQLASEITLKNELQTALSAAQNQLASVQGQWKIDVDTLKDAAVKESNDRQNTEARLTQSKLYLEGEVARLGTQCRDLKDAFTKVRDQVRMEQLALENSNTTNLRFKEQLEDAKIEISMLKTSEEEAVMAR